MSEASIPVDLFNPGHVFACLGFLEAADVLLGDAEGGFDWSDSASVLFQLKATGEVDPFETVLAYLAAAQPAAYAPKGFLEPATEQADDDEDSGEDVDTEGDVSALMQAEVFPAKSGDSTSLPVFLQCSGRPNIAVSHWADGSSRDTFKLYAGNRSAKKITRAMLTGARGKPNGQTGGGIKARGISQLWADQRDELIKSPFLLTPMGGSFNFDARGAWTAIDAGYSPNTQKHQVASSPVVQVLAAIGLEHARPCEFGVRQVRYAAWGEMLPPILARPALSGRDGASLRKTFKFELALSGKNKIATFSQLEHTS